MATRTLHPSELEIQREVEALRDIRRRSITPGALTIDPDLPPNQSPPSPSQSYWSPTKSNEDGDSSSSSHEGNSTPRRRSSRRAAGGRADDPSAIDDPFHLFWVPAGLHPEIAPAEFRAFLKEHARAPPPSDEPGTSRVNSVSATSSSMLARRKSMLSRQYQPSEDDGVEDETVVPVRRNYSNLSQPGPQLTINDLQKLEQLAEEASKTDDPSKFRNVVRRSLSLNISPSALSNMEEIPELDDEADVPIIVPPPGQILRRAARTKIRKPSLTGDGGGHRFGATRRVQARAATTPLEPRTSSDRSSSEHGESIESTSHEHIPTPRDMLIKKQRESYGEEAFIIDAYVRDDEEESQQQTTSPESATLDLSDSVVSSIPPAPPQLPLPDVDGTLFEDFESGLLHPQPLPPSQSPDPGSEPEALEAADIPLPTSPSAVVTSPAALPELVPISQPLQPFQPPPAVPVPIEPSVQVSPPSQRKDKKGGLFSKWGSDKSSKKVQKEAGFFSSLFGGSKKKQDADAAASTAGRDAAQALLGAPKFKGNVPPNISGLQPGIPLNSYSRYPLHVERAIYRLSHIKLANPKRPLYEQVLISNLMFWYLGVINKAQTPAQQTNGQPVANSGAAGGPQSAVPAAQPNEVEMEQQERAEKEKEKEKLEREQREREAEAKKKESGKRGSLTKMPVGGPPGGVRRAEMPIKGPQYEMQHRVMEQEYVNYAAQGSQGVPLGRANSAPAGAVNAGGGPLDSLPKIAQPQPQSPGLNQFHPDPQRNSQSPPPQRMNSTSPAPSGRRSQSPPTSNSQRSMNASRYSPNSSQENLLAMPNGRPSGRSLSATAIPSPPMYQANGRTRKGASAHAVPSSAKRPRSSEGRADENGLEEEDVPLAVWQQRKR